VVFQFGIYKYQLRYRKFNSFTLMTPYIITFAGYFLLHFASATIKFPKNIRVFYLLSLFFAFVIYTDLRIGSDMNSYVDLYSSRYVFRESGPLYGYLSIFTNNYGVNYLSFYLGVVLFEFILLYKISIKLVNYNLFLLLYFSNFFLMMQFNAIRQGLSLIILCYALLQKDKLSKIIVYALSVGIHYSSLMIIVIKQFKKNSIVSYFITFATILILGFIVYRGYVNNNYVNISITFYPALTVKLLIMYIFYRCGINPNLVYAFAASYVVITLGFPVLSRLTDGILLISALLYSKDPIRNKNSNLLLYVLSLILFIAQMKFVYLDCTHPEYDWGWCL